MAPPQICPAVARNPRLALRQGKDCDLSVACNLRAGFLQVKESSLDDESWSQPRSSASWPVPRLLRFIARNRAGCPSAGAAFPRQAIPFKDARMRFSREVSPGKMTATRAPHVAAFTSILRHALLLSDHVAELVFSPLISASPAAPVLTGPSWRLAPAPPPNVLRDVHDLQNADRRHPPGRNPGGGHQG